MGTIGKTLLIGLFAFAFLAITPNAFAETSAVPASITENLNAKPAVKTDAKPEAKTEVKTEPKTEVKAEPKSEAKPDAAKPDAKATTPAAPKTADEIAGEARAKEIMEKANRKVDMNNLPKNLTPILPANNETFVVAVGETKPIAAARVKNCLAKEAPTWEVTKPRLPPTDLVTFSDGGVYERNSARCGSAVPARAVFAKGVKSGSDRVVIFGATITIIVK